MKGNPYLRLYHQAEQYKNFQKVLKLFKVCLNFLNDENNPLSCKEYLKSKIYDIDSKNKILPKKIMSNLKLDDLSLYYKLKIFDKKSFHDEGIYFADIDVNNVEYKSKEPFYSPSMSTNDPEVNRINRYDVLFHKNGYYFNNYSGGYSYSSFSRITICWNYIISQLFGGSFIDSKVKQDSFEMTLPVELVFRYSPDKIKKSVDYNYDDYYKYIIHTFAINDIFSDLLLLNGISEKIENTDVILPEYKERCFMLPKIIAKRNRELKTRLFTDFECIPEFYYIKNEPLLHNRICKMKFDEMMREDCERRR